MKENLAAFHYSQNRLSKHKPLTEGIFLFNIAKRSHWEVRKMFLKIQTSRKTSRVFKALSNKYRVQILYILRGRELSVRRLSQAFPNLTRSAISQHLSVLKKAELVKYRRDKTNLIYALNPKSFEAVKGLISKLDKNDPWPDGQDNIFQNKK